MSERTDREFVGDIHEALQRIAAYLVGVNYESFVEDTKTQDAVIRNLEILGEATKTYLMSFGSPTLECHRKVWPALVTD